MSKLIKMFVLFFRIGPTIMSSKDLLSTFIRIVLNAVKPLESRLSLIHFFYYPVENQDPTRVYIVPIVNELVNPVSNWINLSSGYYKLTSTLSI